VPELPPPLGRAATRIVRPVASRVASPAFARYWQVRRSGRPRVLVYADSRATNVTGPLGKSVFRTYVSGLMRSYCVQPVVLPFCHTTLLDFVNFWRSRPRRCDAVVLHCGIVDFSPRPASTLSSIAAAKSGEPGFRELFARHTAYHRAATGPEYQGEPTTTLYSPEYLEDTLLPALMSVPNLLWVTTNDFVPEWEGTYARGRPVDIAVRIAEFESRMRPALANVVDLHTWRAADIRRFTVDNVHFSPCGFDEVTRILDSALRGVTGSVHA
jgi:hypothetical protein